MTQKAPKFSSIFSAGQAKNAGCALVLAVAMALPAVASEQLTPSQMVAVPPLAVDASSPVSAAKLEGAVNATMVPASSMDSISSEIGNFQVVSNGLWRGALPSHKAIRNLAKSGVKTIIDLRYTSNSCAQEAQQARELGVNYVNIPLGFKHPSLGNVAKFLAIVSKPSNQPVFVHCRQGADRTGTLCGVFRILHDHWSFKEAYNEMRSHHFKPFLGDMKSFVARCEKEPQFSKELTEMATKLDALQMQNPPQTGTSLKIDNDSVAKLSVKSLPDNI